MSCQLICVAHAYYIALMVVRDEVTNSKEGS